TEYQDASDRPLRNSVASNRDTSTRRIVLAVEYSRTGLLPFQLPLRHANTRIVPGRSVVVPVTLLIQAVDADAVQQIRVLRGPVDQRLAGVEIGRHLLQVLRGKGLQLFWVAAALAAIRGQGKRQVQVALRLLGPVGGSPQLANKNQKEVAQEELELLAHLL